MNRIACAFISAILSVSAAISGCSAEGNKNNNATKQDKVKASASDKTEDDGLVLIHGGSFQMGSPEDEPERDKDETVHTVTVGDFYMAEAELTKKAIMT